MTTFTIDTDNNITAHAAAPASAPPAPVFAPLVEHSWTAVRHRNRRSVANRDGFRRTGPQGAAR
jgi:hypothetical protein